MTLRIPVLDVEGIIGTRGPYNDMRSTSVGNYQASSVNILIVRSNPSSSVIC